ncbi:hypothetical protein AB4125_07560 [Vibrio splendidus]
MNTLVKLVLQAGLGLAGLGTIIFYGILERWLTLDVFSQMTPEQTYKAFIACIVGALVTLTLLIILKLASKTASNVSSNSSGSGHSVTTTGKNSSVNIK